MKYNLLAVLSIILAISLFVTIRVYPVTVVGDVVASSDTSHVIWGVFVSSEVVNDGKVNVFHSNGYILQADKDMVYVRYTEAELPEDFQNSNYRLSGDGTTFISNE